MKGIELTQSGSAILESSHPSSQKSATSPRVLIIADSTSARFGGESAIPMHLFRVLRARGIEVWLITHARSAGELRAAFSDDHDRLVFVPDTLAHRLLCSLGRFLPHRVYDLSALGLSRILTQLMARRMARRLVREKQIDVVHQPIPVSPRTFSTLHTMGAPVVIGPMNGGMTFPNAFSHYEGWFVDAFVSVGRFFSGLANQLIPGKMRANALLVANDRTRRSLPAGVKGEVITLVENGVDLSIWKEEPRHRAANPVAIFAYVGRLVGWKAVDLLLEAFATLARDDVFLEVIGDGGMRGELELLARSLGVADRVRFRGWLSQRDCAKVLAFADAGAAKPL